MELDFDAWEGCQRGEIPRAEIDHWTRDLMHGNSHGGESATDLLARVATRAKAATAMPTSCVWAVTHTGRMRALAAH